MMVNWFIFLGDSVFKVLWVGHAVMHFNPLVTARNETTVCAPVYVNAACPSINCRYDVILHTTPGSSDPRQFETTWCLKLD